MSASSPFSAARCARLTLAAAIALSLGATSAWAQTRPDIGDRGDRRERERGRDDRDDRGNRGGDDEEGRGNRDHRDPPTEQEWEQTRAFLAQHSPQRLTFYEGLEQFAAARARTDDDGDKERWSQLVERVRGRIHGRVADLRELREKEPDHFEHALAQYTAEDRLMSKLFESREAENRGDQAAAAAAQREAREIADAYVRRAMEERERSVEQMAEEIAKQQQRLEHERERLQADADRMAELRERLVDRYARRLPPAESEPSSRPAND